MCISLRALVMTLDATGTVSFWESSPLSRSTSDVRSLIEHAGDWKDSLVPGKALGVVVLAMDHRPRLIPFDGCSESAQRAWEYGKYSIGLPGRAYLLPEGLAGTIML